MATVVRRLIQGLGIRLLNDPALQRLTVDVDPGVVVVRDHLADVSRPDLGPGLMGFNAALAYPEGSAGHRLAQLVQPMESAASTAGALADAVKNAVPTYGSPVVAVKTGEASWLVRTPVVDGGDADYAEWVMFNGGPARGMAHAWQLHSARAVYRGLEHRFLEQVPEAGSVSTAEFAIRVGRMSDAAQFPSGVYAGPAPVAGTPYWDFYGFGHGNMAYAGLLISMDGGAENYRDAAPIGTLLRGASLSFSGSFEARLSDGTAIGTVATGHEFSAAGLLHSSQHVISAAGIGAQNSYSAMLPATGVDRIKAEGLAAITIGAKDGSQVGNWGPVSRFAMYYSDRPSCAMELLLPAGHPGAPPGDWSQATTSQTFLLDNANGQRKLYCNWRSGSAPAAYTGTYSFSTRYRIRAGALV